MKSMSFKDFITLPQLIPTETFELAIGNASAPIEDLKNKGWDIVNPLIPTKSVHTYQDYINNSKGEWSVAKHGYVITNSGWFSERSCAYLASGKPVIVQDTGFSQFLPTGKGLLAFATIDEAVDAIETVGKNYKQHCTEARRLAEEYFDAKKVLSFLLEDCKPSKLL